MSEMRELARETLLELQKVDIAPFPINPISVPTYLRWVKNYIKAEFYAFVRNSFPARNFRCWQVNRLRTYAIKVLSNAIVNKDNGHVCFRFSCVGEGDNISDLKGHLCIFRNHLCIASVNIVTDQAYLQEGIDLEELGLSDDDVSYQDDERLFDIGFVGSFVNEYAAVLDLEENPVPIISSIADPRKRIHKALPFHPPGDDEFKVNGQQLNAVRNLCYDVEGIQGPPGTGKSTTIHFIILSRTETLDCTLVTCVQNKAVDSVVEKLAKYPDFRFFVLGNDERLSGVAKQWTVAQQVPPCKRQGYPLHQTLPDCLRLSHLKVP